MPLLIHTVVVWLAGLFVAALVHNASAPYPFTLVAHLRAIRDSAPLVLALAVLACGVALVGVALAARSRSVVPLALLATFAAALVIGDAAARESLACRTTLAKRTTLRVAIDDAAKPGARVTGHAVGDRPLQHCQTPAFVRVQSGRAPPGAIVVLTGTARATDRGLLVDGDLSTTGERELLRTWRGRTGEEIDRLFHAHAPLVRALLIADQDGIAPDVRDRYADAGLVHMLSISGLHVTIIAGALLTLASACRIPKRWATPLALAIVALYVATLGAPAPAVRSAVMLATVAVTEQWQRPVHPWTALALGAALPTVTPAVVLDLGWQLSVGGMAALVAARSMLRRVRTIDMARVNGRWRRARVRRLRALTGWRATLMREFVTGVVATLVTAPLIAWTFGRVSLVAPLSNLVAAPIVALLQPALFLAILLAPWHAAAQLVADAAGVPIALLDIVATSTARIPHAALHIAPTFVGACCAGIASAAVVRASAARRWMPTLLVAAAALTAALWTPLLATGSGQFELHLLDVGQGDAIAMRTPRGRWVIVDAGRRWEGGDAGQRVVVPYVQRRGGAVAAFVMTHAHDDHMGGAASVVQALKPARWWEPAFVTSNDTYRTALLAVQRAGIPWQRVHPGAVMQLDGVTFEVLAPDSSWTAQQHDANETSVVLRVQYRDIAFVLTGDAEANEEAWLLSQLEPAQLRADVLKLGHHGSRTSSTDAFIDAVQPRLGLVSVGVGNRYGHPSPEILDAFAKRGVPLLRTDRDGVVVVSTDGREIFVRDRHSHWTLDRPSGVEHP
mgnify:CR=1 FL=1